MNSRSTLFFFAVLFSTLCSSYTFAAANDPDFGANVLIFDPSMPDIQPRIDAVFAKQEKGEFNSNRYAYFFKPGQYNLDVQLGFYMQAIGLGESPDDVAITGAVRSKATWRRGNATLNFWRCANNLSVTPTLDRNVDVWAVSQGTALRRVHVKGNLNLSDNGWSSGGFIADCKIDGQVDSGSQQQWFSRNSDWASWRGGGWNIVFVGDKNLPSGAWPEQPYTFIEKTPVIREEPYLVIDSAGHYSVMVPDLQINGPAGISWGAKPTPGKAIPIDQFFIAHADKDNAASINAALNLGKNILFTPGIYHLEDSIRISQPDTVVLGLGFPTLIAETGHPAVVVSDVDGIKLSGILLEASKAESPTLVQVGDPGASDSHAAGPIFLYDIFCRAGGAAVGSAHTFVTINSNNVVGDNAWLWRADHGKGAHWTTNPNANGLVVNGNDVTFYGLFVEHCEEYQTVWNGNGGRVYFYQSEMPYDPPSQVAWSHGKIRGYASYKVGDAVTRHEAWGLGVYCIFNSAAVISESAIEAPLAPGVQMHHMVTLRFGGKTNSGINHVINNDGASVITERMAKVN